MSKTMGWDIGGAHLKAVLLDENGAVLHALQLPCPLWKGLNHLESAIKHATGLMHSSAGLQANQNAASRACHAITMTGELVDLFENRHDGVCKIAQLASDLLGEQVWFYAAHDGFVRQHDVHRYSSHIASTNWHASASALAMHVQDALFVDIGSTTTDIIAIEGGKVTNIGLNGEGLSDAYRLAADSLVYTGLVRTPVMALAQKLPFEGSEINVAAEYFATMADVYRLTGELKTDDAETADGKGKTALESARRLARMVGHDAENYSIETWKTLAKTCKTVQMNQIKTAALKHLKPNMVIIGAGAGSFLVKQIADELRVKFMQAWEPAFMSLPEHADFKLKHDLERCFPAFAVAALARQHA